MKKIKIIASALVALSIILFITLSSAENGDTVELDGSKFTIKETTKQEQIEYEFADVDTSQIWQYGESYAPAFQVTTSDDTYFGFCIDVNNSYTPSATYTATKIEGYEGRLAATILTYGFHGHYSIVDESNEGLGWRDTWLALRNVLDVDDAWSSAGSDELLSYAENNLLAEGSYCYKFTYNDGADAQSLVSVPVAAPRYGDLQVVKMDAEANVELQDATFEVNGPSGNKVLSAGETWSDIEPGEYTVIELTSPHGYLLNNTTATVTVNAGKTAVVTCEDQPIKGKIKIHKTGENPNDYVVDNGTVVYNTENLSNAVFTIYAKEDIYTGYDDLVYERGDVVAELTTDESGYAEIDELYLGEYYIDETQSPEGYRILMETFPVTLDTDEDIPLVEYDLDCTNYLEKGNFVVNKTNSDDGSPVSGADIAVYDADMNLITIITSGDDGVAMLNGLIVGEYKYQEVKAPSGFNIDSTIYTMSVNDYDETAVDLENEKTHGVFESFQSYGTNSQSSSTSPNTGIKQQYLRIAALIGLIIFIIVAGSIYVMYKSRQIK